MYEFEFQSGVIALILLIMLVFGLRFLMIKTLEGDLELQIINQRRE
jgi:hypothetical protein